jgi:hypothetical protein
MDTALATVSVPAVQPTWRRVTHLADLVEFFDPAVQVCVWQRDVDATVSEYLAGLEQTSTSIGLSLCGLSKRSAPV